MADAAEQEIAQGFGGRSGVDDEALVLKYATAAALAVDDETLALDDRDTTEGINTDTPYWRTKRFGHRQVRDHGHEDDLDLYERVHLQGTVKRLLGDRRFVEHVRAQREQPGSN